MLGVRSGKRVPEAAYLKKERASKQASKQTIEIGVNEAEGGVGGQKAQGGRELVGWVGGQGPVGFSF